MTDEREDAERNVYGTELRPCSQDPETGFLRDGHCRHLRRDPGRHEVCAVLPEEFLAFSDVMGNDLVTPRPKLGFPGLEPGDRWCLCLARWIEAREAGSAPPIVLEATHERALDELSPETLREYEYDPRDADA